MCSAHRLSLAQLSTLIGCVMGFHEKAGRSQGNSGFIVSSWFFSTRFFAPLSSRCRHASIRTLEERSRRSVHVGRFQFSRCCHLINDLSFHLEWNVGQPINAVTGTRLWAFVFFFLERF